MLLPFMYSSPQPPSLAGKRRGGGAPSSPFFAEQRCVGVSSCDYIIDI